jgi:hypothetical protein
VIEQHKYERIDKGVKRPKRSKVENETRMVARTKAGQFVTKYTEEQRQAAVTEAVQGLEVGIPPEDIASKHGIPRSTLYSWLIGNDVAAEARSRFFHYQIGQQLEAMALAQSPLDLARARDLRRAWAETAAVRDHHSYGQKTHVTVEQVGDLAEKLRRARERVIEGDAVRVEHNPVTLLPQATDK